MEHQELDEVMDQDPAELVASLRVELRLSVPEAGKRLLPLPIAAWHATVGVQALDGIARGDRVLIPGSSSADPTRTKRGRERARQASQRGTPPVVRSGDGLGPPSVRRVRLARRGIDSLVSATG